MHRVFYKTRNKGKTMEEKNELGDIILNKNSKEGSSKKIILAAATLGIILIVVVLLMSSMDSNNETNLPQNALPPKPKVTAQTEPDIQKEEPMFEDAEIIDEDTADKDEIEKKKLEEIAKKLKQESQVTEEEKVVAEPKTPSKPVVNTPKQPPAKKALQSRRYYVQIGSFSKYSPNKKFLASITKEGYSYRFHKATIKGKHVTKVLVGPFQTEREARNALKNIRKQIVKDAFLTKL